MSDLPSFFGQYAVVFNDYMDTLGGGERSCLAYAKGLMALGFDTEILSTRPIPSMERIVNIFGNEFDDVKIRHIQPEGRITGFLRRSELGVFVNHTYMSFEPNPAKIGIYSQMFPGHIVSRLSDPEKVSSLDSYQLMLNNSSFTKNYTDAYWEYSKKKSLVLNPPIGKSFIEHANDCLLQKKLIHKEKKIVHIGRFNPGNHNKNQKLIIESFMDACASRTFGDWTLTLIGNVNDTAASRAYFNECLRLAEKSDGRVIIKRDLPANELRKELERSFGYIHATGAFIPPGQDPHRCEHYGLSILEAMAYGCIPVCYARGGIFDVIEPGISGLPYVCKESMNTAISDLVHSFEDKHTSGLMQYAALKAASEQGQDSFNEKLAKMIAKALM